MDKEQAKQLVKGRLRDYLQAKQINTEKPFCCLNPAHEDKNPSMSYDEKRQRVHCFSCGASYDIFDLIGMDYRLTETKDIFRKAYELYGVVDSAFMPKPKASGSSSYGKSEDAKADYTAYFEKCRAHLHETDYHRGRGISDQTAARFGLGFDPCHKGTGWRVLIIPTGKDSFVARNTDPNADKKDRYRKTGEAKLFNTEALSEQQKPVFIVEGEIDAISLEEAGARAVALGSTANANKFIGFLKKNPPHVPLLVATDNDEAGEGAKKELCDACQSLHIPAYPVTFAPFKDASEALTADRDAFCKTVAELEAQAKEAAEKEKEEARQAYRQTNAAAYMPQFLKHISENKQKKAISTGFDKLDRILGGGLYEGLYVLGAISSLGKTTFSMQIADEIARNGTDVLFFSLEMSKDELIAKSLSRLTAQTVSEGNSPLTMREIMNGNPYGRQEGEAVIKKAVSMYGEIGKNLFYFESDGTIGAEKVKATTIEHKKICERSPVVIVDYLQILEPKEPRATDKSNTDFSVLTLKRLSRDLHIPVIAISSFNRESYSEKVGMNAFKESGAIEYSSDVLIGLQLAGVGECKDGKDVKKFDVNQAKRKNPREVEAVILKNRNGMTGDVLKYEYYPAWNLYRNEKQVIKEEREEKPCKEENAHKTKSKSQK